MQAKRNALLFLQWTPIGVEELKFWRGRPRAIAIASWGIVDVVDRSSAIGSLKASRAAAAAAIHLLHFQSVLLLLRRLCLLVPANSRRLANPPVARLVAALESHICRWTRPHYDAGPVPEHGVLTEWPMTVLGLELVAVEILSCSLAAAHQEKMICPQTRGIGDDDDRVNEHGKRNTPYIDGMPESGVIVMLPHKKMGQSGTKQKKAHDGSG